jgi:hypothetical protein
MMAMGMAVAFVRLRSPAGFRQVLFHSDFVEFVGLALDYFDGVLGALAEAGAEPVAEVVGREHSLAVYHLDGPFGAGGDAESATVAFVLVDLNNFPDHYLLLYLFSKISSVVIIT